MPVTPTYVLNQVKTVFPEVISEEFPERALANGDAITVDRSSIKLGQKIYEYTLFKKLGTAAIYTGRANDIPKVTKFKETRQGYVRYLANGYDWSLPEEHTANFANQNDTLELTLAAREGMLELLDTIGYLGDPNNNLLGLLYQPNVPVYALPADGTGASTTFASKTAYQMYRDLTSIANSVTVSTNGVKYIDTLALDLDNYQRIMTTIATSEAGDPLGGTVLDFFLRTQAVSRMGIRKIIPLPYLAGKGAGGTNVAVGYLDDPRVVKFHIPVEFAQDVPTRTDMAWSVPFYAVTGGVECRRFQSMVYVNGI